MPRPKRICMPNFTYHITSRCLRKLPFIKQDFWKDIFLEVVDIAMQKYNFHLIGYQIMDDHFHLIIKTLHDEANISRIMQYIKARFAERYNKYMKTIGPFWNERFHDNIIELSDDPQSYLLKLLWYLGFNAVRSKAVVDPRDYIYGTINCYLNTNYQPKVKITLHEYYLNLGSTTEDRIKKFLYYEDAYRKRFAWDI